MSVRGRQIPEMDAAQAEIESGRMTKSEAAKKFNLSARWIMRKDWYKAHRAKQKADSNKPVYKMPSTMDTARMSEHPLRVIWYGIMRRCYIPTTQSYPGYGGRGIQVEERWHNLRNFIDDLGPRPSSLHSIDRINNDGDYGPSNCRWATPSQQNANSRTSFVAAARQNRVLDEMQRAGGPISIADLEARIGENWSPSGKPAGMRAIVWRLVKQLNAVQVSPGKWALPTGARATTQPESKQP